MDDFFKYLGALALIVAIANTVWVWLTKSGQDLQDKLEKLEDDLDETCSRVQSIEGELKHLPSKDSVNALLVQLERVNGTLSTQKSELDSVGRTVRRIEDALVGVRAA